MEQKINFKDLSANELRKTIKEEFTRQLQNPVEFKDTLVKIYNSKKKELRKYSFQNRMLIELQNPDASDLRTYNGWKKIGNKVKRGQRAIMITAPQPSCKNPDHKKDMKLCSDDCPDRIIFFRKVPLFDISQTEKYEETLLNNTDITKNTAEYEHLVNYLDSQKPFDYNEIVLSGGLMGKTTQFGKNGKPEITVAKNMKQENKWDTLLHEFGHYTMGHLTDDKGYKGHFRGIKETQAEMYSVISTMSLGVQSEDIFKNQISYIAGWTKVTEDQNPLKEFEAVDKQFRKDFKDYQNIEEQIKADEKVKEEEEAERE